MKFQRIPMDEARRHLVRLVHPKTDTSGGVAGLDDIIGPGIPWSLVDAAGLLLCVFVVYECQAQHGRDLEVRAAVAVSGSGRRLTEEYLPEIERIFGRDCDTVTIHTRRAGLVGKLEKAGYHEAGKIMTKRIEK